MAFRDFPMTRRSLYGKLLAIGWNFKGITNAQLCKETMDRCSPISQFILTDEIGIRTGICADYRLKTLYRPIYRRSRDQLIPVGVTPSWLPMKAGRPVDPEVFLRAVPIGARGNLDQLLTALAVNNLENTGVETLELHVDLDVRDWNDAEQFSAAVGFMLDCLDTFMIDRDRVMFRLAGVELCEHHLLRDYAARLRELGIRIDLRNTGTVLPDAGVVEILQPEVATIDGTLFARVTAAPEAKRLLDVLLGQFRRLGTVVHIDHLDAPERLTAALDTRAILLQGDLLAKPTLAGTTFPTAALSIPALANIGETNASIATRSASAAN